MNANFVVFYVGNDPELKAVVNQWRAEGKNISKELRRVLRDSLDSQPDAIPPWAQEILRRLDGVTVEERQAEVSKIDLNGLFDDDNA